MVAKAECLSDFASDGDIVHKFIQERIEASNVISLQKRTNWTAAFPEGIFEVHAMKVDLVIISFSLGAAGIPRVSTTDIG